MIKAFRLGKKNFNHRTARHRTTSILEAVRGSINFLATDQTTPNHAGALIISKQCSVSGNEVIT